MFSVPEHSYSQFTLPDWSSPSSDNVLSQGQTISVAAGRFQSLHLLGAADGGSIYTNNISVSYADGTTATQAILVPGWKANRVRQTDTSILTLVLTQTPGTCEYVGI